MFLNVTNDGAESGMTGPDFWTPTCSRGGATRLRPAATMIHMPRTRYACRPTRSVNRPRNLLCPYLITWLRTAPASGRVSATSCVASGRGLRSTQFAAVALSPLMWLHHGHCRRLRVVSAVKRRGQGGLCAGPLRRRPPQSAAPGHRDPGYRGRVHPGGSTTRARCRSTPSCSRVTCFAKQEQLFSVVQIGPTTLLTVDMDVVGAIVSGAEIFATRAVDLAGDVSLEAAHDFGFGFASGCAPGEAVAGGLVAA